MRKVYNSPEMEIVSYKLTDIILASINDESSIPEKEVTPGGEVGLDDGW